MVELLPWGLRAADASIVVLSGLALRIDHHLVGVALILYLSLVTLTGGYDVDACFSVPRAWRRTLAAWITCGLFAVSFQILLESRIPLMPVRGAEWSLGAAVMLMASRAALVRAAQRIRQAGGFNQRVAIYGANDRGFNFFKYVMNSSVLHIDIIGVYDERMDERLAKYAPLMPLRGNLDALIDDVRRDAIDQVIVALPWSDDIYLRRVVSRLAQTPVRIRLAPEKVLLAYPDRPIVMLDKVPLMTLFERPISGLDQGLKRAEDVLLAGVLVALVAPLLVAVMLAIRVDSPGPIFFRQRREGFNSRDFWIWKFRSMYVNCGQADQVQQATRRDPRVTRVGRILRRSSIDELPQLFNVLQGQMSLVGPRPHAPSTRAGHKRFADVIDTYAARHNVKPGITGWAQVCGWRGETDTEEKLIKRVEHDLYYIEHWSVGFDLYILLRTLLAVAGNTAY